MNVVLEDQRPIVAISEEGATVYADEQEHSVVSVGIQGPAGVGIPYPVTDYDVLFYESGTGARGDGQFLYERGNHQLSITSGLILRGVDGGLSYIHGNGELQLRGSSTNLNSVYIKSTGVDIYTYDTARWRFDIDGHLRPQSDNALNFGAPTYRPQNVYAGAFQSPNQYTDASNYERFRGYWSAGLFYLQTESAGSGNARSIVLKGEADAYIVAGDQIYLQTAGSNKWSIEADGTIRAQTDNVDDIGQSGAYRPRSIYAGTSFVAPAGSAAAPSITSAIDPTTGVFFTSAGTRINIAHAGVEQWEFVAGHIYPTGPSSQNIGYATTPIENIYTNKLYSYDTWVDASNYRNLRITGSGIYVEAGGTESPGHLSLRNRTNGTISFYTNDSLRWQFDAGGNLDAYVDNTYNIGNIATSRPANIYVGTAVYVGTAYYHGSDKVVAARQTGWSAPTGTASRATFDPSTVTTEQLAERLHALIDDLTTHGLIGA